MKKIPFGKDKFLFLVNFLVFKHKKGLPFLVKWYIITPLDVNAWSGQVNLYG